MTSVILATTLNCSATAGPVATRGCSFHYTAIAHYWQHWSETTSNWKNPMIHLPPSRITSNISTYPTPRVCILPQDIFRKSVSVLNGSFQSSYSSGTFSGYFIILFRPHFILKLKQYSLSPKINAILAKK